MNIRSLLGLAMWLAAAVARDVQEPQIADHSRHHYLQGHNGDYRYIYVADDQTGDGVVRLTNKVGANSYTDTAGKREAEGIPGVQGFVPRILSEEVESVNEPRALQENIDGSYYFNIDTGNFRHHETKNHKGDVRGRFGYKMNGGLFEASYNTREGTNDQNGQFVHDANSELSTSAIESLDKSSYSEDGAEETDAAGIVHGRYTYKDEDGVPVKIEYEAGPDIGFVLKSFTKEKMQLGKTVTESNINPLLISKKDIEKYPESNFFEGPKSAEEITQTTKPDPLDPPSYKHSNMLDKYDPKDNWIVDRDQTIQTPATIEHLSPGDIPKHYKEPLPTANSNENLEQLSINTQSKSEEPSSFYASYKFGFSADGQTRNEEADAQGNVHGSYSYKDSNGMLTTVEYEAGAEKGFVIKRITQKGAESAENVELQTTNVEGKSHSPVLLINKETESDVSDSRSKIQSLNVENNFKLRVSNNNISSINVNFQQDTDSENVDVDGPYSFSYEIPDQSKESSDDGKSNFQGQFSFVTQDDGNNVKVNYEEGLEQELLPKNSHLPSVHIPSESTASVGISVENLPNVNNDGSSSFSYETIDQSWKESTDAEGNVREDFSFVPKEDGVRQKVSYKANIDNGFVVQRPYLLSVLDRTKSGEIDGTRQTKSDGSYSYSYETSDQSKKETGDTTGQLSHVPSDDVRQKVSYIVSPEEGFIAEGSHIPPIKKTTEINHIESKNAYSYNKNSATKNVPRIPPGYNGKDFVESGFGPEQQNLSDNNSYSFSYDTIDQSNSEIGDENENNEEIFSRTGSNDKDQRQEPFSSESNTGFIDYGEHLTKLSMPQVILDLSGIRRAVAVRDKNHLKVSHRHREVKCPGSMTSHHFTETKPDRSYAFSYETNDHSRQESVDSKGNVYSIYQNKLKGGGQTVVSFISKTVDGLAKNPTNKDELTNLKQSTNIFKSRGPFAENPIVDDTYSSHEPFNHLKFPPYNHRRNVERNLNFVRKHSGIHKVGVKSGFTGLSNDHQPDMPVVPSRTSFTYPIEISDVTAQVKSGKKSHNIENLKIGMTHPLVPGQTSTNTYRGNVKYKVTN